MSTKIEWSDEVWNPITGCDKVSPGCDNCYIDRSIPFRMEGRHFDEHGKMGIRLHADRLDKPLRWKKPRRVFVNSLSDLFHADVSDEFIVNVFAVMALASDHTFQVLTKRPQRMAKLLDASGDFHDRIQNRIGAMAYDQNAPMTRQERWNLHRKMGAWASLCRYPLPNVWLGTSVENQRYADLRIPYLLTTPAAKRFLSAEPLLGPITFRWAKWQPLGAGPGGVTNHLDGLRKIDWVIVGGESGPGARPMSPWWPRQIRDECVEAGVPFFFKQHGEFAPAVDVSADVIEKKDEILVDQEYVVRLGKKAAGRLLDGRTWDEFPE